MLGRSPSSWVGVAASAAVLIAATTAAGAVGGRDGQSVAGAGGGTLKIGRAVEFATLDPGLEWTGGGWQLEFATCAKLYSYPDKPAPEGALVIPEVAKGFPKVSQDGRTNTIALRRTFRFHTGERITAANFVAAFNRDANPQLKSDTNAQLTSGAVGYLDEIVGADAVIKGRATAISGIQATGRYALQIRTKRPLPDLVSRLTMPFFCPIAVDTPPRELDQPLGSGPYYIASHVPNRQLVLNRNPFYGGNRHPHVQQIVYTLGIGGEACRVAVEQNQLDFCFGLSLPDAEFREIAREYGINRPGGRFFFQPGLATWGFWFNHDRPAFKGRGQIPLKQAINWAIDRHALVAARGYLGGNRTDQILPPALGRAANIYPHGGVTKASLARARALLAKAKRKPTTLVLYTGNFPPFVVAQAQIFQYDLKRIGIDVEVKYYSQNDFGTEVARRGAHYDVFLWGWGADYADPSGFFGQFDGRTIRKTGNANYAFFDRPRYNGRMDAINRLHGVARRAAWATLDVDMMRNDPPWAPFMNTASRTFISQSFGCFVSLPVVGVDLVAACKK